MLNPEVMDTAELCHGCGGIQEAGKERKSAPADHSLLLGREEVALAEMAGRVNVFRPFRTPLRMLTPQALSLGPYPFRPYSKDSKYSMDSKGQILRNSIPKVEWEQVINPHGEEEA
jgi:hypothetical protein